MAIAAAKLYKGPTSEPRLYSVEKLKAAGYDVTRPLPSVTTVLGRVLHKPAFVPAALAAAGKVLESHMGEVITPEIIKEAKGAWGDRSKKAMDFGSRIHAIIEAYSRGEYGESEFTLLLENEPKEVQNGIDAYLEWTSDPSIRFVATEVEKVVCGPGYAGTVDAVGVVVDGRTVLCDWKSGKGGSVYPEYVLQWNAYCHALRLHGTWIEDGYIVSFDKETGECYHHYLIYDPLKVEEFGCCLRLYEGITEES